jgi:2-keto-4-pentenoate hydratase/2-oxohepta-3-ene-1,7-dioic acid hydratase in catechol pathway
MINEGRLTGADRLPGVKIARYTIDGQVGFGVVEELDGQGVPTPDTYLAALDGHPFGPLTPTGIRHRFERVRLLAPVLPSKVVAIGKNYADHAAEMGGAVPTEPVMFLKPSTSVVGPGDAITLPRQSTQVDHEVELAVVIGRLCSDVPAERARDVILGYTVANDVSARDLQKSDGQWARAKGFDTFCPIGPWIETELDFTAPHVDESITCSVNGESRQAGRTADLVRGVAELVAFVSAVMTLLPGDLILTGTPAGVGPIVAGDEVSVAVSGVGRFSNRVTARD